VPRTILLLSGPMCAGKTEFGTALIGRFPNRVFRFKTHEWIRERTKVAVERRMLQGAGESLDRRTRGRWIRDDLARDITSLPDDCIVLVDSVRIKDQIDRVREGFGHVVTHVHLTAPREELARRFRRRRGPVQEGVSFRRASSDKTERAIEGLAAVADLVVDTKRSSSQDVAIRVASHIGLLGDRHERLVDVLVGGQYGSEGKGQIAAYLAPEYQVLVRVGGPNAGHSVFGYPPRKFYHLPAGTDANEDAQVILGPGAVLHAEDLLNEIRQSRLTRGRLFIDPQAMIIEAKDRKFEERLKKSIGSTGQGVGAATARKVLRESWGGRVRLAKHASELAEFIRETASVLDDAFADGKRVLLEGTQGTGLSLHHGFYPHVTSRDTTAAGCLAEAGIAPGRVRRTLLVCRSYPIRVQNPKRGSSGHMSRELSWAEIARRCDHSARELRRNEKTTTTKRRRRVAEFDWALFHRSIALNGPTDVALTFADYIGHGNQNARRFEALNPETLLFVEEMERVASAPVSLVATRFHFRSIIDRRSW